jgi:hypothetical protein
MIWRIKTHPGQELLKNDGYLLETLVVFNIVFNEFAAGQSLVTLIFEALGDHMELMVENIIFLCRI